MNVRALRLQGLGGLVRRWIFPHAAIAILVCFCLSGCGSVNTDSNPGPTQDSDVDAGSPGGADDPISPSQTDHKPSLALSIAPVYCCNPRSMVLESQIVNTSISGDIKFLWQFGDGRTGEGASTQHTYSWPGEYVVTVQAELPDGTVLVAEETIVLPGDPALPDDDSPGADPDVTDIGDETDPDQPDLDETPTTPEEDPDGMPDEEEEPSDDEPADPSTINAEAIAGVASGQTTTADASWWGFDANDATEAIQSAINSRAHTVIIPNMGSDWVVRPLFLASNKEIIFEDGVVLVAKSGAFRDTHDCLLNGVGVSNVTLRGYNAVLRMRKTDYTSGNYSRSEWRHVLSLEGVNNFQIFGLSFQSSGGDGIYIGPSKNSQRLPSRNVLLRDCDCFDNYRQGISVVSAENLTLDNCTLRNTSGTAPQAGIDLEPDDTKDVLNNVQLINCKALGNAGSGFMANLELMEPSSKPISVSVVNMLVQGSRQPGIRVLIAKDGPPGGTIEFRDSIFEVTEYAGLGLKWHLGAAVELSFTDCEWRKVARLPWEPPMYMEFMGSGTAGSPGGIRFTDCLVNDQQARDTIRVMMDQVVSGTPDVTGTIFVSNEFIDSPIPPTGWPLTDLNVLMVPGP